MAEVIPFRRGWRDEIRRQSHGTIGDLAGAKPEPGFPVVSPFATRLRAVPMSPATIYRYHLAAWQLEEFLGRPDLADITRADVEKFIVARMESTAGSTVAGTFVALCQFFKFAERETGLAPPTAGMSQPRFERRPIGVPDDTLLRSMIRRAASERTFEGTRDAAMLGIFYETGARLAEVTNLALGDLVDGKLLVTGKSKGSGPVTRPLSVSTATHKAISRYLRDRRSHPWAERSPRLWLGLKGPMTTSGVRRMIWHRSEREGQRIHPHQFRHALAHRWKSEPGLHDGDLMEVMGWNTEAMLHRYGKSMAQARALKAHRDWLEGRS